MNLYEEYALVDQEEKTIKAKKEALRLEIVKDMITRGVDSEKHDLGKFTVTRLKTYTYPEVITELSEELKAKKVEYENSESAVYEEKESLRYTPVKL